jgi:hypothetical protein
MHTSSTRNNELHSRTLIKLIFSRFEGRGCFLITATVTRINTSTIKEVSSLLIKQDSFN